MNLNKFEQFQHVHSRCEFDNLINCTYTKILSKEESEKNHELDRSSVVKQSCTDLDEIWRSPPTAKDNDCDIEKEFDPYFAEKMKKIEKLLEEEKKEEIEFQEFRKENAKLRDRVQVEITESVIKKLLKIMFNIWR